MSNRVDWQLAGRVLESAPDVIAAWAFGSAKDGQIRPGGDVDVAVLFDRPPSFDERAELLVRLQQALRFEDIDLVVLNGASPITRFEAASGRPLFTRDLSRRAAFVSLAAREYESAMAFVHWGLKMRSAWRP